MVPVVEECSTLPGTTVMPLKESWSFQSGLLNLVREGAHGGGRRPIRRRRLECGLDGDHREHARHAQTPSPPAVVEAAGIRTDGKQARNRLAPAIEHARRRVDSESTLRGGDAGPDLEGDIRSRPEGIPIPATAWFPVRRPTSDHRVVCLDRRRQPRHVETPLGERSCDAFHGQARRDSSAGSPGFTGCAVIQRCRARVLQRSAAACVIDQKRCPCVRLLCCGDSVGLMRERLVGKALAAEVNEESNQAETREAQTQEVFWPELDQRPGDNMSVEAR